MSLEDRVKKEGKGEMERIDPQEKGGENGRWLKSLQFISASHSLTHSLTCISEPILTSPHLYPSFPSTTCCAVTYFTLGLPAGYVRGRSGSV